MAFHEDHCRVRTGHAAENFAIIQWLVLNLLKTETSQKIGIAAKRKKAGWGTRYLTALLKLTDKN